jgi:nitrite reductase/ring-hydroxylating ferredoxin subunit
MAWHHVADTGDFGDKNVIGRECAGHWIALYRLSDGYFATQNLCTHAFALLSNGEIVDDLIECPAHFGLFEIRTGKAAGSPVDCDLDTFPVRLVGDRIEILLEEPAA